MKKIITYILYLIAISSAFLASGIKDIADWEIIARPFFAIFVISLSIALTLTFVNQIRRITYPVFVCISAWGYKHKVLHTAFAYKTYRLYTWKNHSYLDLFEYVQDVFDVMYV